MKIPGENLHTIAYAHKVVESFDAAILSDHGESVCPKCKGPIVSLDQIRQSTGRNALSATVECKGCGCLLGLSAFGDEIEIIAEESKS